MSFTPRLEYIPLSNKALLLYAVIFALLANEAKTYRDWVDMVDCVDYRACRLDCIKDIYCGQQGIDFLRYFDVSREFLLSVSHPKGELQDFWIHLFIVRGYFFLCVTFLAVLFHVFTFNIAMKFTLGLMASFLKALNGVCTVARASLRLPAEIQVFLLV